MNRRIIGLLSVFLCASAAVAQSDERSDVQQIEDVVKRFYEAWNQQDYVAAEELVGHSVIELDLRDRKEPQSWVLRKMQTREEFLDAIVGEWTGTDDRYYNPDTHKYIKEVELFDISVWDDLAMAMVQERLVGLSGPANSWEHSAWLLRLTDGAWKIGGALYKVPAHYESVQIEPRSDRIRLRLFVDGSDEVFVDGEGVWIQHRFANLPGRHDDGSFPTHINGVAWQPVWQGDKTRKVYLQETIELSPDFHYSLVKHRARDIVQIEAEPQKPGDPLSILFVDNEDGADWYDVEVHWSREAPDSPDGAPEPSPPGREDLLLEVLFDGDIRDSSPHQRRLESKNVALTQDRAGKKNGAGYFDGEAVVDIEGFLVDGPFSVSIWAKYDETEDRPGWWNNCIWAQDDGGDERVFQLSTLDRRVTWHRMRGDEDVHSKLYLKKEHWYHLVAVYDGDFHRLFVDGVLQDHSQSTVEPSLDQPIYIGAKNLNEKGFFFTGGLDDARLYGRVLTVSEVNALYHGRAE